MTFCGRRGAAHVAPKQPVLVQAQHELSVEAALAAMQGRRALVVGDFMLDAYLWGQAQRVSREAPVLVIRQERLEYRLGGAANTARNLRALGMQVRCVGAIGADAAGEQLRAMLAEVDVGAADLVATSRRTALKTRVLAGDLGTHRQQVLRIDQEPDQPVASEVHRKLATAVENGAASAEVVIVSDYGGGTFGPEVLAAITAIAARGDLPVCVDSRHSMGQFRGTAAVTPNVPEAEAFVGFALLDQAAVERAGAQILSRLGCKAALITQGHHGMTLFRPGHRPLRAPVVGQAQVTDVTGAGDAVVATLGAGLAAGLHVVPAMRLANCAAGVVVTKVGTAYATPPEIVRAAHTHQIRLGICT